MTSQNFCIQTTGKQTLTSDDGAACAQAEADAQALLDGMTITSSDTEFCVISSAGEGLGCYIDHPSAEARLQETGQERLLQVIGETARLEQREVLGVLQPTDPNYASTPLTCGTPSMERPGSSSFPRPGPPAPGSPMPARGSITTPQRPTAKPAAERSSTALPPPR